MPSTRQKQLYTLRRLIVQAEMNLYNSGSKERAIELIGAARGIVDDLIDWAKLPTAAELGKRGGSQTAKRGSEYFRQLAAKRKTFGGGRPRNETE